MRARDVMACVTFELPGFFGISLLAIVLFQGAKSPVVSIF